MSSHLDGWPEWKSVLADAYRMGRMIRGNSAQIMQPIGEIELLPIFFSVLLYLPFLAWGVYLLRQRYVHKHDLHPAVEIGTLALLAVFYWVELGLLAGALRNDVFLLALSVLGLTASGLALYLHVVVSVVAHPLVDMMMPERRQSPLTPSYSQAEALEQRGAIEEAIQEYMVVSRMFPKDGVAAVRIGDNYMKLDKPDAAAQWFEKGLRLLAEAEPSVRVVNRLTEIYVRDLGRPEEAERVIEAFLEKFPGSAFQAKMERRLERVRRREFKIAENGTVSRLFSGHDLGREEEAGLPGRSLEQFKRDSGADFRPVLGEAEAMPPEAPLPEESESPTLTVFERRKKKRPRPQAGAPAGSDSLEKPVELPGKSLEEMRTEREKKRSHFDSE